MAKSAEQMASRWGAQMANPATAQAYTQGIDNTTRNPMQMAASAEAQARYVEGTARASTSGRMAAKLNAVPLEAWKTNAKSVGAQRLASGATKARGKVQAHFQKWAPIYQSVSDTVRAMPKGGMANAQARAAAAISMLMQAAGKA